MLALSRFVRPASAHLLRLALCLSCLGGLTTRATAQAPFLNLGVYGGVPHPDKHRGKIVSAHLIQTSPASSVPLQITLPLNGLLDYSFYYAPRSLSASADRFLMAGIYHVDYLDVHGKTISAGTVHYTPNVGFTNGVQVPHNPPNFGPWATPILTALGIQGVVTYSLGPGHPPHPHPARGAVVELLSADASRVFERVTTNGDGFYSFYYTSGINEDFIRPGYYVVRASLFGGVEQQEATYNPNTDPTSVGYFVLGARAAANFNFAQP